MTYTMHAPSRLLWILAWALGLGPLAWATPQEPQRPARVLSAKDPLLQPPFLEVDGSGTEALDAPGRVAGDFGPTQGVALESGKILIWRDARAVQNGFSAGVWDPSTGRLVSDFPPLVTTSPLEGLLFKDDQDLLGLRSLGRPVSFDPFRQAWVHEFPKGWGCEVSTTGSPTYHLPGGWTVHRDETPGGPHAWKVMDPKTGASREFSQPPLIHGAVGRSDGRIVLLSGRSIQILDPRTGVLTPGPRLQLSGWDQVCVLPGDKALLAGGAAGAGNGASSGGSDGDDGTYSPIRGLYEVDLFSFKVKKVATLRFERIRNFAMIPTPEGKLLVVGGTKGFGPNGTDPVPEVEWIDLKAHRDLTPFRLRYDQTYAQAQELPDGTVILVRGEGNPRRPAGGPECFDPAKGVSTALKPIPAGWRLVRLLSNGHLLLSDTDADRTAPKPPKWPIPLMEFDPWTGRMTSAGELKTSHPRNALLLSKDRVLFLAPTDLNLPTSTASEVELWAPATGSHGFTTQPYRYLRLVCALKDGTHLIQAIGPDHENPTSMWVLPAVDHELQAIQNPSHPSNGIRGFQLKDGRILLMHGWEHNYTLRKSYYFLDEVWDPLTRSMTGWPPEHLESIQDKAMRRTFTAPRISLKEVAWALGFRTSNPSPSLLGRLLHPVQGLITHLTLKDGRMLFVEGAGVSFFPATLETHPR